MSDASADREIPVRIKVSRKTHQYLVHHAEAFDGDLDAAVRDLLERYKAEAPRS